MFKPYRPWFRTYIEDMIDNPDIAMLSDQAFRLWMQLQASARRLNEGGRLPNMAQICYETRATEKVILAAMKELTAAKLIAKDGPGWLIPGWQTWQPVDTSAERQRRYRERKRIQ